MVKRKVLKDVCPINNRRVQELFIYPKVILAIF